VAISGTQTIKFGSDTVVFTRTLEDAGLLMASEATSEAAVAGEMGLISAVPAFAISGVTGAATGSL
jgi:hypothetical protein